MVWLIISQSITAVHWRSAGQGWVEKAVVVYVPKCGFKCVFGSRQLSCDVVPFVIVCDVGCEEAVVGGVVGWRLLQGLLRWVVD
jgi:hypothetical protein